MPIPSPEDRAALDGYIKELAGLGGGLTIEDFRFEEKLRTEKRKRNIRATILVASTVFMVIALVALFFAGSKEGKFGEWQIRIIVTAVWALALGGLGAISSIFINLLKLVPQQTLRSSDQFEVVGRIVLCCIFGTILGTTIAAGDAAGFFEDVAASRTPKTSLMLLLPFLAGYSITLVLNLFEKATHAIELAVGVDGRRIIGASQTGTSLPGRIRRVRAD